VRTISIVGGGPAAMMLSCMLDPAKYRVTICEKNVALGRKFLVAGKGGFNLTHSEPKEEMLKKYIPASFIQQALFSFDNDQLQNWLQELGIETYTGTSKRVFPIKGIRPIEVLHAFLKRMQEKNVQIKYGHTWQGWNEEQELLFGHEGKTEMLRSDITVFALGGASWKVTGSDGSWLELFQQQGIGTHPFLPSNCAFRVDWKEELIKAIEGTAIKNAVFSCGTLQKKGEAVLTRFGIEGSAVYALSSEIRKQLLNEGSAEIRMDLKPDLPLAEIEQRLKNENLSVKDALLKKVNITEAQLALIKKHTTKEEFTSPHKLAALIKSFPLRISAMAPLDDAISSVGGIALQEVNEHFELKKMKNSYCIGEMLDWDAPTGGYLLQACFSMGHSLAAHLNRI
jgi:uncharacterized flavoprotein (TIGR03862 family)